ncbi:MAG: PQQ-binding-like beta-propeller repeat protein [Thermomicrobiales bacterium]
MLSNRPALEARRIGRYWDSVATGTADRSRTGRDTEIDASLAETILRLEQMDDAAPASAAFSRQFEIQFQNTIIGQRAMQSAPVVPAPPHVQQEGPSRGLITLLPERSGNRWLLGSIAATVLFILAIAASSYVISERRDREQRDDAVRVISAPPIDFSVPMDRGNPARSGIMPGPGIAGTLEARWSFDAGRGGISAPALVGSTIYVTSGTEPESDLENQGSVIAIDAGTGSERWRFPTTHAASGTPAVAGGIVYAGDAGGNVYALDARTGEELWRRELETAWVSPPLVVEDTVFVATAPYRVALNVAVQRDSLVVGSGLVGLASESIEVYALDAMTGDDRWHSTGVLSGQPGIVALDAASGESKWTFPMASLESGPAIGAQRVYAASTLDGTVRAIDLESGQEIWHAETGEDFPQHSSPAVRGSDVYVTTAFGQVICFDAATGAERWRANAEHISLNSSAIVVDDLLYVVDTAFAVSAFSTLDGTQLWSEQLELTGQVVDSPIVSNGNLFIVTSLEGEQGHIARLWVFAGSASETNATGDP